LLSEYAQLDSEGRYKVSMPFDFHNDDHPEGLASARVRMMQPYAGKGRGMQFPMAKGTEVLLTFVDGDPDRPLIAGAINTAAAPGPVTADNQTESVIQTGGNNKVRFEDEEGSERIILESPKANSWLRIGTPNDPLGDDGSDGVSETADDGIRLNSSGSIWTEALGKYGDFIAGAPKDSGVLSSDVNYQSNTPVSEMLGFFNLDGKYKPKGLLKYSGGDDQLQDALNKAHIKVSSLDTFTTQEGNIYDFGGYWNYNLGNSYAENHMGQDENVTLNIIAGHDLLDVGGPSWTTVKWPTRNGKAHGPINYDAGKGVWSSVGEGAKSVGRNIGESITDGIDSLVGSSAALSTLEEKDTMLAGDYKNMWVDKSFGHSYDYKEGDSISVTKGSSLDVQHGGGRHVEVNYSGSGVVTGWSHSDGGLSREKKWTGAGVLVLESSSRTTDSLILEDEKRYDRKSGIMYSSSNSQNTGMTGSSFEYSSAVTASASVNAGFTTSTDTFIGGTASLSTYIGLKASVELTLAGSLSVENTDVKLSFPGFTSYVKTNVVDLNAVAIDTLATKVANQMSSIESDLNNIETAVAKIITGGFLLAG
jgi:hypothetical protein